MEPGADSRLWLLPSGNLYIVGVSLQDEGLYTCSAVNLVTQATRHSRVAYQLTINAGRSMLCVCVCVCAQWVPLVLEINWHDVFVNRCVGV